jgi:hypothetical protein
MKSRIGADTHREFKKNFQNYIFLAWRSLKIGCPKIGITELNNKLYV